LQKPKSRLKPRVPALRFDFHKAVKQLVKDHPELRRNSLFIDAKEGLWLEPSPVLARLADDGALDEIEETVKTARRLKSSFAQAVALGKKDVQTLVFHPDRHPLYAQRRGLIDDTGSFDHESGHILAPQTAGTLSENTADAYALLRRLQRFGVEEPDTSYCGWKRAYVFATSGVESHLTTFTADRIVCDAKTANFLSLTPAETKAIARDYAKLHTPDATRLAKLTEAFKPLKGAMPEEKTFRRLARITLQAPADSDTFYLGARILSGPMAPGGVVLDGKSIVLQGAAWEKTRQKLEKKLKTLPAAHHLRRAIGI